MAKNKISGNAAIDKELGLDRYEGDETIYENVLETFKRNNKDTLKKLNNAIDANNRKLAHRIAHSLRGAAGTIGATKLADAAFHIENLLASANMDAGTIGTDAFEGKMALLESEYIAVFDELKPLVKEKRETGFGLRIMSREKTLELIDKLAPFLEAGDASSLEYLDEIDECFRPVAEGFQLFITQMEHYDFEQAFETMKSVRQFMGGCPHRENQR